jgi:hypothetical protein
MMIADDYDVIRQNMKALGIGAKDPFTFANEKAASPPVANQGPVIGRCSWCRKKLIPCDGACSG